MMAGIERGVAVQLAELTPHPRNYNAHPPEQVEELRRSLRTFGQVRDVVTWQQYVIAGHGVAEAARAEGWTEISATRLPDDWPEERVLAYLAADNETARLSRPDEAQLAALLNAVSDEKLRSMAAGGEARLRELLQRRAATAADEAHVEQMLDGNVKTGQSLWGGTGATVRIVLAVLEDLPIFEKALRATGLVNRGDAVIAICRSYLEMSGEMG